jgi:hypothetical protein
VNLATWFLGAFFEYDEEASYWSQWDDQDELVVNDDLLVDTTSIANSSPEAGGMNCDQVDSEPVVNFLGKLCVK